MSNLWFNVRIGCTHYQWGPEGFRKSYNDTHEGYPFGRFKIYCAFGRHF